MAFYHNLITEKSWQILQKLKKECEFILIGGWAVFIYSQNLKSKDVDIILDYEYLEKFRKNYNLNKNQRLKKYEIKKNGIDIDIYLPHFSKIGLPIDLIKKYCQNIHGFKVPQLEILLILKQYAWQKRVGSIKGKKDEIDIIGLFQLPVNFDFYLKIIKENKKEYLVEKLKEFLKNTYEIPELGLNRHKFAKLKSSILDNLKN